MSGRITEASRRRMEARDQFVPLTPGPYLTVENAVSGEPVLSIQFSGHKTDGPRILENIVMPVLEMAFSLTASYRLRVRKTA